jgi:phage portal protein BeeE
MGFWSRMFGKREPIEKRSSASGFTAEIMAARESYISGRRGIAELTATAQSCISLWENGLGMADVDGTDVLDRRTMALLGRSLAVRGEAAFLIRDRLVPCADWDLRTRDGKPLAYRVSVSEAGGGRTETALAAEVLHVRIGADPVAPWLGTAPLRRASLTAGMLNAVESALAETYDNAPIGSQIVPMPEQPDQDNTALGRSFRAQRGRVLLRESVQVAAAGGPAPASDWRPSDVTPDISKAMTKDSWTAARDSIAMAFGVLPCLFDGASQQGPAIREAQRHLAMWTLAPIGALVAEEATAKLGSEIVLDVLRPTQAFDASGRARALATIVEAMGRAKEAGLPPDAIASGLKLLAWD